MTRALIGYDLRHTFDSSAEDPLMSTKGELTAWVHEALMSLGGQARLVDVAREIWTSHASELLESGDLLFTWQYDMRWSANQLRRKKIMKSAESSPIGVWVLSDLEGMRI